MLRIRTSSASARTAVQVSMVPAPDSAQSLCMDPSQQQRPLKVFFCCVKGYRRDISSVFRRERKWFRCAGVCYASGEQRHIRHRDAIFSTAPGLTAPTSRSMRLFVGQKGDDQVDGAIFIVIVVTGVGDANEALGGTDQT